MALEAGDDERLQMVRAWLTAQGLPTGPLTPASSDASFRRYFRLPVADCERIVMDAPPEHEDVRPFVRVAELMHAAGLHVPEILAQESRNGFLLLSDLGRQTYLDVLTDANADGLMTAAVDALVRWQAATRPGTLPVYDEALLQRELQLFPDWYLQRHLGVTPTAAEAAQFQSWCDALVARARAQPQVWVHRDYMPRNLMPGAAQPGILDFQDAVEGPVTYDLISLLRDAFITWPEATERRWLELYHQRARAAGVPVPDSVDELALEAAWMGVQRHLKVLGIFARIRYRDGKPRYLEDAPRFRVYLQRAAATDTALAGLVDLVEQWHQRAGAA
ncbi:MAG: phosphotransferase [Ectothiorhodospiraceae bacterium]